jgi:hypothetical protein
MQMSMTDPAEGFAAPRAEAMDPSRRSTGPSGAASASGPPALPPVPQIPDQAHWAGFGQALERGPADPLSTSLPIIASVDENTHPVTRAAQAVMDERRLRLAGEYAAAGRPAPAAPPADEGKLRQALAERIAENVAAQDILTRTSESVGRANALHATTAQKVAELEAAERRHTAEFARQFEAWAAAGDAGGAQPQLADPGAANISRIKLGAAKDEHAAATIARDQLGLEHERAQRSADNAQQLLFSAAKAVLSSEARAIADEIEQLEQLAGEAFRRLDALAMLPLPISRGSPAMPIQFDAVTTKVALDPPRRGRMDMAPPVRSASDRSITALWRRYFDRLLVDAAAHLDQIEVSAVAPVAPLVLPSVAFVVAKPVAA